MESGQMMRAASLSLFLIKLSSLLIAVQLKTSISSAPSYDLITKTTRARRDGLAQPSQRERVLGTRNRQKRRSSL